MNDELRVQVGHLKDALGMIEAEMDRGTVLPDRIESFKSAVDSVRNGTWAILCESEMENYDVFLARLRLRRAKDLIEHVLSDLDAGHVSHSDPKFKEFAEALARVAVSERPSPSAA